MIVDSYMKYLYNSKNEFSNITEMNKYILNGCYQFINDKIDNSIIKKLEEADYILISIPPIDGKDIV